MVLFSSKGSVKADKIPLPLSITEYLKLRMPGPHIQQLKLCIWWGKKKKKKQHLIEMTVLNDISMNAFVNKFYHPRITNKVHLTISGSKSGRAAFKLTIKIQENI